MVNVHGWSKQCDSEPNCPKKLTVYSADGQEISAAKDLSSIKLVGKKAVNDYELVNVSGDFWVESDYINIDYCSKTVASLNKPKKNGDLMGSGEECR